MIRAYIALGSNVGDREAHLALAKRELSQLPLSKLVAMSDAFATAPVGPPGQGEYLNAAAAIDTELDARELLKLLHDIERKARRERREKWGPRTLDLDLLLYGDRIIDEPNLAVPHPHMHERDFVLRPLASIAPDAVHPRLGKTVRQMLAELQCGKSD